MKKRLFYYNGLILLLGFASFFAASVYIADSNNLALAKDSVKETARLCANFYSFFAGREAGEAGETGGAGGVDDNSELLSAFVRFGDNTRITVIAPDGAVLSDSQPVNIGELENHTERPEISAAANGKPEAYARRSDTMGADLIYYALKVDLADGDYVFVRAAIPVASIATHVNAFLFQSLPALLAVVIVCFFFTRKMIDRATRPMEYVESKLRSLTDGKYAPGDIPGSYEEINKITRGIDGVAIKLQDSFILLRDEKAKLDYILNNIGDGLFVVDETKNISLINAAALNIFNASRSVTDNNLNYLSYNKTIAAAVDDCVNNEKSAMFELTLFGRVYFVAVKRLPESKLTIVVLTDVTENRENLKRREEFFGNASHELKTPLTAIKGFNELTAINCSDAGIRKYVDGIARETDRMLSLIEDMLKLSELENAQKPTREPQSISLLKVVKEALETLSVLIDEKGVKFEIEGDAEVRAAPGHIYDLVKNIVENAARYVGNGGGGAVSIKIESDKRTGTRLCVSDNGIGISPEEQTRIFERFYRVEKSRSQRGGGTGLGLSIVKHICLLYDWNITLKSKLGVGTEVTVTF